MFKEDVDSSLFCKHFPKTTPSTGRVCHLVYSPRKSRFLLHLHSKVSPFSSFPEIPAIPGSCSGLCQPRNSSLPSNTLSRSLILSLPVRLSACLFVHQGIVASVLFAWKNKSFGRNVRVLSSSLN